MLGECRFKCRARFSLRVHTHMLFGMNASWIYAWCAYPWCLGASKVVNFLFLHLGMARALTGATPG